MRPVAHGDLVSAEPAERPVCIAEQPRQILCFFANDADDIVTRDFDASVKKRRAVDAVKQPGIADCFRAPAQTQDVLDTMQVVHERAAAMRHTIKV